MAITTVPPCEDHGLTGSCDRTAGGLDDRHALRQILAVAGDQKEGVVDADTDPDHGRHLEGPGRNVDQIVDETHGAHAERKSEQRRSDRQTHGDHRTERNEQDDDSGDDPDHLASAGLGFLEGEEEFTVGFDPVPGSLVEFSTEFLERLERRRGKFTAGRVEHSEQGDAAVFGQLRRCDGNDLLECGELALISSRRCRRRSTDRGSSRRSRLGR